MTDDLEFFDALEEVTLTIGSNAHAVTALRRPLLVPRIEEGVQIDRAAWHVRVEDLAGDVPTVGCELTAGAETWTTVSTERLSWAKRYRLVCDRTV